MISQNMANRVGLTLQFVSLWLVTPQIIGEEILNKAEMKVRHLANRLGKVLAQLKWILFVVFLGSIVALFVLTILFIVPESQDPNQANKTSSPTITFTSIFGAIELIALALLLSIPILRLLAWMIRRGQALKRHLLVYGAGLFTLGFALLLWATWLKV